MQKITSMQLDMRWMRQRASAKNDCSKSIIGVILCIISLILSSLISEYWANVFLATLIFVIIQSIIEDDSLTHLMYLIGFVSFIYTPAIIAGYFTGTSFDLYYLTALLSIIFLQATKGLMLKAATFKNQKTVNFNFIFSALLVIVFSFFGNLAYFFLGPLLIYYSLSMDKNKKNYNIFITIVFWTAFFVYYFIGWNGYGRTVTFSYMAAAVFLLLIKNKIKINKFIISLFAFSGVFLLSARKSIQLSSIETVFNDSAISPYYLAANFINDISYRGYDISGLMDQVIFFFFSFVPRTFWPDKPYGFGFKYVLDNMEEGLIDAGHSVAATLIGDHIYYIGYFGLLSGLAMLLFVAMILRSIHKLNLFYGQLHLIFAVNMTVLVWGGMTSFSARIIFPIFGIFIFFLLEIIQKRLRLNF